MGKILWFEGRRNLVRIPIALRCHAKNYIEKIFSHEHEMAGVHRERPVEDTARHETGERAGDSKPQTSIPIR